MAGVCEFDNKPSRYIKRRGNFLTEEILASQEGLCSMEWVSYY